MMKMSNEINELGTALALVHSEIKNPKQNKVNKYLKNKYADLSEITNVSRPVLAKHGLSIVQAPSYELGILTLETIMIHSSGQWVISEISMPVDKPNAHGIGSAITYCRRYSLASICNLSSDSDDDGQEAIKSSSKEPKESPVVPKAQINKACKELDLYYAIMVSETASDDKKVEAKIKAKMLFERAKKVELIQVCDKYISLFNRN